MLKERILKARKGAKLSQNSLGEKVGCGQTTISNYENGQDPQVGDALKIAKICSVDPAWLLTGEGTPNLPTTPTTTKLDSTEIAKLESGDTPIEELSQEDKALLLKVLLEDREDHRERLKILEDYIEYLRGILEKNQIEHYPLNQRSGTEG